MSNKTIEDIKSEESWQRFLNITIIGLALMADIFSLFGVIKADSYNQHRIMTKIERHNSLLTKEEHDIAVINSNKSKGSLKRREYYSRLLNLSDNEFISLVHNPVSLSLSNGRIYKNTYTRLFIIARNTHV